MRVGASARGMDVGTVTAKQADKTPPMQVSTSQKPLPGEQFHPSSFREKPRTEEIQLLGALMLPAWTSFPYLLCCFVHLQHERENTHFLQKLLGRCALCGEGLPRGALTTLLWCWRPEGSLKISQASPQSFSHPHLSLLTLP